MEGVESHPTPEAFAWTLAGSSVNIKVRWWSDPTQISVVRTQGRVIAAIKNALSEAGIDLPFPTRVMLFTTRPRRSTEIAAVNAKAGRCPWTAAGSQRPIQAVPLPTLCRNRRRRQPVRSRIYKYGQAENGAQLRLSREKPNVTMTMLFDDWRSLGRVLLVGTAVYISLVAILRISGKRTLTKFNAFDFVVTVALGSTLATVLLSRVDFVG